jgi:hypothetical protein
MKDEVTREYQQAEDFKINRYEIARRCRLIREKEYSMLTTFFAILLKFLSSPAMVAALLAFLQKTLHP